jgi:hypothetical protein
MRNAPRFRPGPTGSKLSSQVDRATRSPRVHDPVHERDALRRLAWRAEDAPLVGVVRGMRRGLRAPHPLLLFADLRLRRRNLRAPIWRSVPSLFRLATVLSELEPIVMSSIARSSTSRSRILTSSPCWSGRSARLPRRAAGRLAIPGAANASLSRDQVIWFISGAKTRRRCSGHRTRGPRLPPGRCTFRDRV